LKAQDARLRPIRQMNAGPGAARNAAMKAASGRYFAFLDSDDRATPHRLATQVDFLGDHPAVHVLGGAMIKVSDTGEQLGTEWLPTEHEDLERQIFRICPFFTSTVMARREFFEKTGGFAEDLPRAQDYDWWLRGCRRFRYHNLSIPLAFYTRSDRLRWRDIRYSTRVIFRALRREGILARNLWYVLRPTVSYGVYCLGYKRR
jgi:glycosyltransferase involved in cell wall biosynthesis